jgi:hypothetical protein
MEPAPANKNFDAHTLAPGYIGRDVEISVRSQGRGVKSYFATE